MYSHWGLATVRNCWQQVGQDSLSCAKQQTKQNKIKNNATSMYCNTWTYTASMEPLHLCLGWKENILEVSYTKLNYKAASKQNDWKDLYPLCCRSKVRKGHKGMWPDHQRWITGLQAWTWTVVLAEIFPWVLQHRHSSFHKYNLSLLEMHFWLSTVKKHILWAEDPD